MSQDAYAEDVEARYLPGVLLEMVRLVGLPATLAIVRAYRGIQLYVPSRFDPDHPLVKLAGHAAAAALIERYGGDKFDIPRALIAIKAVRDKRIRAERAAGATHARLAITYELTERQIRNILGPEEDDRQMGMF